MTQPRLMLSYLPAATAPTRIRKTACIGLVAAAVCYLILAVYIIWDTAPRSIISPLSSGVVPPMTVIVRYLTSSNTFYATVVLLLNPTLLLCAAMIRKGRRWPIPIARFILSPLLLVFCVAAVAGFCFIPIDSSPGSAKYAFLWILTIALPIIFTLLTLLTLDIRTYLLWMYDHPGDEMPKRPFI